MVTLLDITLATPAENLALDEALLDHAEENDSQEILRFWESPNYFLVLGIANKPEKEAFIPKCLEDNVPIYRRCSGGGSVVQGPGCLNYALILNIKKRPELKDITSTTCYILNQIKGGLSTELPDITIKGQSDLTWHNKKFSGNAQRRKRNFLLFHGTLLYNFDLTKIPTYLNTPPKEPDYRQKRAHLDFVTNIPIPSKKLKSSLANHWQAIPNMSPNIPSLNSLIQKKYQPC
jgi:lipoate-protein ligase A